MAAPRRIVMLACLLGACTPAGETSPRSEVQPQPPAMGPVELDGSCAHARPLGAVSSYALRVRTQPGEGGFIRVRADPSWSAADTRNVLGRIVGRRTLWATGPLKGATSAGIGYAVPLRDLHGRTCRGYVSQTVVELLPGASSS